MAFNRFATFLATLVLFALLLSSSSQLANATLTLEMVTIQNCSSNANTHVRSGVCSVDPLNPTQNGRLITCMDQVQQCAQLINFNDAQCSVFSGVFTAVCGQCQKLNANPPYWARPNCDPTTNLVTWDTNCGVGCTNCLNHGQFPHPFSQCSPALGGNGWSYNQGVQPCDAVNVTIVKSTTCAAGATMMDQFIVGQYSCNFGEYMSCTPKNPNITTQVGSAVVMTQCPFSSTSHTCSDCPQTYFPPGSCQPSPAGMSSVAIRANCDTTPAMCGDLVIHGNTQCSMFIGRSTPVCGSCMMLSATNGPQGTWSLIACNETSQAVTISHGCNADCSQCTMPNYIVHGYLQCSVGDPSGTSTFNRGLFPCNTVTYNHYSDAACTALVHVEVEAEGICQFDRQAQCVERLVTFQNCSNPSAAVTTRENVCVNDPVAPGKFREYGCMNQAPTCATLVAYKDALCQTFDHADIMVCGQCMLIPNRTTGAPEYLQIMCNATTQLVTLNTNCDSQCANCATKNAAVHPIGACSIAAVPGFFIRNEGMHQCDAVHVSVYNTTGCNESGLEASFTVSQNMCSRDEFLQCTADPLPTPSYGNELVYTSCTDQHCGFGCTVMLDTTAGGCMPNFMGRPGAHVLSCDAVDSVCADLTIHQGFTCGSFVGSFHPVCNSCQPGFNATDPYGFIYVTCSQSNPNVTMSAGCDSKCQTCSQPNVFVHPYLQCSADSMKHDRSILNRGVIPCSTLSVIEYSDVTCRPSTQVASWHMARGFCEMGYLTSCNAATIGIQNCSACSSVAPNQAACNKSFITENSCIPDPYSAVLGGMRTVSCVPTWQQCVHLALFADAECTTYRTSAQAVCNQCNQLIETDGTIVYAMLTCNDAYNWVSIQTHCNSDCTMCNDTDSTLINNQCNPTNYIGGVFNFGATECDAVQISQYHTAGCTGQPVSTYMVGQHQCSFDEYYECSARPLNEEMQYIGKVVQRHCPNPTDFACTNCSISEAASGSCIFNPPKLGSHDFGSTRITCDGSHRQRTCAVLGVHTNAQCSDFAGVHQPVCGTCFRDSDLSYTQIVCDPSTQDVIFNKNCTQDCNSCTVQEVHAYMSCMAPLLPEPSNAGKYFFNRGLVPCETINIQHYNSINCNPSTLAVNYEISTDSCDNGFSVQCVPHVVHIQNCSSPTQLETVVAEGACTPDPFGLFRKYRCFDESLTCATLIQYEGADDCEPQVTATGEARPNIIAGVCGSCLKRPTQWNPNSTTFEFFLLQCDPSTQDVWFDGGCNENCQSCTAPRQETHKFMQCSVPANMPAGRQASMFNQGVRPCSGVQISVYPDNSCTGSSINWFEAGQRDCGEQDHLYIYCDSNPNLNLPDGGQVLMSMCPWQHGEAAIKRVVEGDCTSGCMTYPVVDGACAPAPPGETRFASHRVSCDTQFVSKCADIVLFNTTGASNALTCTPSTFVGIHTPVCGSCYTFGMDTTFTHAICDEQAQQITFETGCNSDCTQCTNSNNNPVAMNECDMGQRPGWAFVSRGLFQCSTAVFMHYSSTDCDPGTSTGIMIVAQGVCEFNQRLQCAKNVITTQNCSCPTCAAAYTTENTCTEDDFGMFRQYSCAGVAQSCVNMGWFKDDQCQDYMSGYTVVCNTCWKSIDPFSGLPTYTGMMCNYSSQEVISLTQCSDGTCSDCIGMQFVHPFNNCSRFQRGSSLFNTGIVPCDSISVKLYNDSKCSTQSVDTWVQGQDFCALDEYISCMAAPIVNPSVKLNALNFYTCPQDQASALGFGCIGCTVSKEQSGQCYAADKPGHYRITNCDSEMAFCGAFVIHNDTTCKGGYLGDHNPVCGSCAQWFGQDTYTKVHCDIFSKNISLSFGCNAGCSQCTSNVTHGFMECSQLITKPEYTLYNRGVMPCSTVSITEYTAADCNAGSVVGTYQVPQDLCQVGHKVSCIWEPEVPTGGGSPESSGMSAGAAVGVTAVVLIAVFGGAFAIYKYRQRRVYRTVDPQWSAMNDTGAAPTPSNIQGSYGSLQDNAN